MDSGLALDMPSCQATYDTDVEETREAIRVELWQTAPGREGAECADSVTVELQDPVGDRAVTVNGERVEVRTID